MDWFTADTHFCHDAIRRHSNRPFSTTEEMDAVLLDNINGCVKRTDTLYHLGDFSWRNIEHYRSQIKCKNVYLILGNHDKYTKTGQPYKGHFKIFSGIYLIYRYKCLMLPSRITLCHYPMKSWQNSVHGAWHFHGHCHGLDSPRKRRIDVGVDAHNFMPLSIDQLLEIIMVKEPIVQEFQKREDQ